MATTTLTQPVQRKAFKRTFLRDISAKITFAETDLLGNGGAVRSFLKENFGIEENFNIPKLDGIDIVSVNKEESYKFSSTTVSVRLDSNIYRYFEDSLIPRLHVLISFLQILGINEVESFSITKGNLFQANAKDAFNAWRVALVEAFKAESIRELADAKTSLSQPFKMSIEGVGKTEWGEIRVPFIINVPEKSHFRFQLNLEATSKSILVSDLIERGIWMNNDLFESFTEIISDKLINLMQQD